MLLMKKAKETHTLPVCPKTKKPIDGFVENSSLNEMIIDYLAKYPFEKANQYQLIDEKIEVPLAPQPTPKPKTKFINRIDEILLSENTIPEELAIDLREMRKIEEEKTLNKWKKEEEAANRLKCLSMKEKAERETFIKDIQNIIWALGFEIGPKPKGKIDNFSLLFFALIEQVFLEPLPWQKIVVNDGPKIKDTMYPILKAAKLAIETLDPEILNRAKESYLGQYDRVKTVFGGELSITLNGYANFAKNMGTVTNQPGWHVYEMVTRAEIMLENVCKQELSKTNSFSKKM